MKEPLSLIRKPSKSPYPVRLSDNGLPMLYCPEMERIRGVTHGFSLRLGGVSEGYLASLNLSFRLDPDEEKTSENYRRVASALHTTPDRFVLSRQVHEDVIRVVTEEDAGKGVTRPRDYESADGLVTDVKNLVLTVFSADCVTMLFADKKGRAVGAAHAGWRGTLLSVAKKTVEAMKREYGVEPEDLVVSFGPCICKDCFEVHSDVAEPFQSFFGERSGRVVAPIPDTDRFTVDLSEANRLILINAGVPVTQIFTCDVCTSCNRDLLFSHRATHGKRGLQGAFIALENTPFFGYDVNR